MLDSYEINLSTDLIISFNNNISKVYENGEVFRVKSCAFDIIKEGCLFFGSSYEGRAYYTGSMLGYKMKLPIILEESYPIIFFPTSSPRKNNCIWISYKNLFKYSRKDKNVTTLYFKNNKVIDVNVNYNIIDNQVIRCIKLESLWNKRNKDF